MNWLTPILFLLLTAGHSELQVMLINRLHAGRISLGMLRHLRHVHDLLMLAFPFVIVWFVGLNGPKLLLGGDWNDLSFGWRAYFSLCVLGLLGQVVSAISWHMHAPPPLLKERNSRIENIATRLGFRPYGRRGRRRYHFLSHLPGNEIFQLDVNELVFEHPALPPEWDGLCIVQLTDAHFEGSIDLPYFEEVAIIAEGLAADMIVFTGDLIDTPTCREWIPHTLGRLTAPLGCYYILGNHDWPMQPDVTRDLLDECGWIDLASRVTTMNYRGRTLALGGNELPWMGTEPDFCVPSAKDADFRLLLSHTPDNLAAARRSGVDLMLSGHNHGGQVTLPVLGPIYSPSRFGTRFAAGSFWHAPTLLHVSRGIAAQHPLRWRCKPELTRIVLRAEPNPERA